MHIENREGRGVRSGSLTPSVDDGADDLPRTGVPGVLAFRIRRQMLANGWSVLPLLAHGSSRKGAGKAPAISGWQRYASLGAPRPTLGELAAWEKISSFGTGVPGGDVVGIDLDFSDCALVNEARDVVFGLLGETPFVRQGSPPKLLLVYRATEMITSQHLKVEGGGDGIDIIANGAQFVAFGIHPRTLRPYSWLGTESPLTASPDLAPVVTQDQIREIVYRLSCLVPLNKTGGRAANKAQKAKRGRAATCDSAEREYGAGHDDKVPGDCDGAEDRASLSSGATSSGEVVRGADGRVVDGRETHLRNCIWRAAVNLRELREPLTATHIAAAGWALFVGSTNLDDGKWTRRDAESKSTALLARIARRNVKLPERVLAPCVPTAADRSAPVAEVRAALAECVDWFFDVHMRAERAERQRLESLVRIAEFEGNSIKLALARQALEEFRPTAYLLATGVGSGKSFAAESLSVRAHHHRLRTVVGSSTTVRARELLHELKDGAVRDTDARLAVWLGMEQPDPLTPGLTMCRDPRARRAARKVGASAADVCGTERTEPRCRHFAVCSYRQQQTIYADVWSVTNSLLFTPRPENIEPPDLLIPDETFVQAAKGEPRALKLTSIRDDCEIVGRDGAVNEKSTATLRYQRERLALALETMRDGYVSRAVLVAAGVSYDDAQRVDYMEAMRSPPHGMFPGMEDSTRDALVARHGPRWADVEALRAMWREIARIIRDGEPHSGLLRLTTGADGTRDLVVTPFRTVHKSWLERASVLLLDATAPDLALIARVLDMPVKTLLDTPVQDSPHTTTIQITGAPVSGRALGIVADEDEEDANGEHDKRAVDHHFNLICRLAAQMFPRRVGVGCQLRLEEKLVARGMPDNVVTCHFNAVAGLNSLADVAVLIVIGRPLPPVRAMEAESAILYGAPPEIIAPDESRGGVVWYQHAPASIRLKDGTARRVMTPQHPDPRVESLRWLYCDAPVEQMIGRGRGALRRPDNPLLVLVVNDLPLSRSVDRVVTWGELEADWSFPAAVSKGGMVLTTQTDLAAAYPAVSEREARRVVAAGWGGGVGRTVMEESILHNGSSYTSPRLRVARYQKAGAGQSLETACILPNGPEGEVAIRKWLQSRFGKLTRLEIERRRLRDLNDAERRRAVASAVAAARELARPLAMPGVVVRLGGGLVQGLDSAFSGSPIVRVGWDAEQWAAACLALANEIVEADERGAA